MRGPLLQLVVFAAAIAAFSATFVLNPPAPRYYPIEHTWRVTEPAPGPAMGWYGRSGVALLAAAAAAVTARFAAGRASAGREPRTLRAWVIALSFVIALSLVLTAGAIVREQMAWFHKIPTAPKINHEY